jgi:hypothetical protein
LQVLPVALTRFALIGAAGDTIMLPTGRDGSGSATVPAGSYTVISLDPVEADGSRFRWELGASVRAGDSTRVDLTNLNAMVTPISAVALRPAAASTESELYRIYRASVLRIEAGLGHGSGFIADTLGGVILTNAHVVGTASEGEVSVLLDSVTRVPAQILARDNEADVAVLRIARAFTAGRTPIPLGITDPGSLTPGDRLVAFGYPVHQDLTMTTGIASGVRDGAIISDVNINPGNSGGPMLLLSGEAIALNTFLDPGEIGPGVSGSILVSKADAALRKAAAAMDTLPEPPELQLPTLPRETMSATALRAAGLAMNYGWYRRRESFTLADRFDVLVQTPLTTFVEMAEYERQVGKDRRKREEKAGLPEDERFGSMKEYRDWQAYVGELTTPVVSLEVSPRAGETTGSVLGRLLTAAVAGTASKATYKFDGDVRGVELFRGDSAEPVVPLRGGHAPVAVYEAGAWVELKDVADLGFYVFDPEVFRPSADGTPPVLVIGVSDLKHHPERLACRVLPKEVVAETWNGFEDYYREHRSDQVFVVANERAKVKSDSARAQLATRCAF